MLASRQFCRSSRRDSASYDTFSWPLSALFCPVKSAQKSLVRPRSQKMARAKLGCPRQPKLRGPEVPGDARDCPKRALVEQVPTQKARPAEAGPGPNASLKAGRVARARALLFRRWWGVPEQLSSSLATPRAPTREPNEAKRKRPGLAEAGPASSSELMVAAERHVPSRNAGLKPKCVVEVEAGRSLPCTSRRQPPGSPTTTSIALPSDVKSR